MEDGRHSAAQCCGVGPLGVGEAQCGDTNEQLQRGTYCEGVFLAASELNHSGALGRRITSSRPAWVTYSEPVSTKKDKFLASLGSVV